MGNFCTNCGAKLGKDDNFCTNCGTRIDKSDMKHDNRFKSSSNNIEKEKTKRELKRVIKGLMHNKNFNNTLHENGLDITSTGNAIRQQVEKEIDSGQIRSGGVEFRVNQLIVEYKIKKEKENVRIAKQKEEEKKKLQIIDEIFESAEIKSEIIKNNIGQTHVISIKDNLKNKIINKRENMSETEIRSFIKTELEKARKEQETVRITKEKEMRSREIKKNEPAYGGHCSLNCAYCYEEYLDSGGGIVGDFDSEGIFEYYCRLGHQISFGSFCKDYK